MAAAAFSVALDDQVIEDLRARLLATRWPTPVRGSGWDYGVDQDYLRDVVEHWATKYSWADEQARLNELPHRRAVVDGTGIHFVHAPGEGPSPVPLLLLHGWPSSFLQMRPIIPMLTAASAGPGETPISFDVVAASLPGYGFSDVPTERGMDVGAIGELLHRLMTVELGYSRYAVRASDLGAGVSTAIALHHPEALVGVHASGTNPFVFQVPDDLSPAEQTFLADAAAWNQTQMGYAQVHSTRPDTLGVGLNDSPAGLAAWLLDKFHAWSDNDGDLESVFDRDDLLTNLTIYWATGTATSAVRLYYETAHATPAWGRVEVPSAFAMLPADFFPTPREWLERSSRVDRYTQLPRGGHFGEWEVPDLLAEDIRAFFRGLR